MAELIARQQHRRPLRQQQRGQQIAHLPRTQRKDRRIIGVSLHAVVAGEVVRVAVTVVLAVGLVVAIVVADQIVQGESIMRRHQIDAGRRSPAVVFEQVGRASEARGKLRQLPAIATPQRAHRVAEAVVPLGPARRKLAQLVAARADVPWLGNQLHLAQDRVLAYCIEEAARGVEAMPFAAEDGCQVEAEPIHPHLGHPVAQGVHDHAQRTGIGQIERVAGTGIVDVIAAIIGQTVVAGVVDALERQRRAQLVAFGRVVVDHVQDDLDARVVQARDHLLELGHGAQRQIACLRREEADGVVSPVVAQPALEQLLVIHVGMHRQQLDGGHPQMAEVVDHRIVPQRGEGTALGLRDVGMLHGQSAHVGFVDHGPVPGRGRCTLCAPAESRIDHGTAWHVTGAVAAVETEIAIAVTQGVAEQVWGPLQFADDLLGIGIQQQLVGIEAMALFRRIRAVHPVAVTLPGPHVRQVAVPDLVGVLGQRDTLDFTVARVEQAEFHPGSVPRVQREVHTQAVPGRPQRERPAFAHPRGLRPLTAGHRFPPRRAQRQSRLPPGARPCANAAAAGRPGALPLPISDGPMPQSAAVVPCCPFLSVSSLIHTANGLPARSRAASPVALKCSMRPSSRLRMRPVGSPCSITPVPTSCSACRPGPGTAVGEPRRTITSSTCA